MEIYIFGVKFKGLPLDHEKNKQIKELRFVATEKTCDLLEQIYALTMFDFTFYDNTRQKPSNFKKLNSILASLWESTEIKTNRLESH